MKKRILFLVLLTVVLLGGCSGGAGEGIVEGKNDVLSFERAKEVENQLVSTDELVKFVGEDTIHWKVVYFFDAVCKPCREHLQKELREMYAGHDTSLWRFYLVAGFNGLHRLTPDEEGNLVEDTLETIRHYAGVYRKLLPSLGYDMKDVYLHYDPSWERSNSGVYTPLAKRMFVVEPRKTAYGEVSISHEENVDVPFRCAMEGVPQLFKTDRHNRLQLMVVSPLSDTLKRMYEPNDDYTLDTTRFYELERVFTSR